MPVQYEVVERGRFWKCLGWDESGSLVSEMSWDVDSRIIGHVWTRPDRRREGIATAMFRYAVETCPARPIHSRNRTPDGKAWVASLRKVKP